MSQGLIAVIDAGPAIHLYELRLLNILSLFQKIHSTTEILEEINSHIAPDNIQSFLSNIKIHSITPDIMPDKIQSVSRIFSLDSGEISALALIIDKFPGTIFLCDDSAARLASDTLGIQSTGTIGIIIRAGAAGIITKQEAISSLESIHDKSSLHINKVILKNIISQLLLEWNM